MKKMPILVAITLVVYLFGFGIYHIVAVDKDFSSLENRVLAERPEFRWDKFFSGKYGTEVEDYIADQFPMRNEFIAIKSNSQKVMQRTDNNGVYIGENKHFLQQFESPDYELLAKNVNYLNQFAQEHNVYFLLAPTATKVNEDLLPLYATPYDEEQYLSDVEERLSNKVAFVSVLEKLQEKNNEYIYYMTDHHWTSLGAYYSYVEFCKVYGIEPLAQEQFEIEMASEDFYGSLFSKGNFTFANPDRLELYHPKEEVKVEVNYVGTDVKSDSVYERSHLEKKDKYSVFLDNNHPMITIDTSVNNGKKLLVVKDSYANSFVPFLVNHFEEIHILDLRFLNMKVSDYAAQKGIDDVLVLYNVQNFAKETGWSKLQ